ncbi:hypothetical protein ABBQ38_006463 [Trebouxia sp. C0009 RCD-2024]
MAALEATVEFLNQRVRSKNMVLHGVPDTAAISRPADLKRFVKCRLDDAAPGRGPSVVSQSVTMITHIGRPGGGNRAVLFQNAEHACCTCVALPLASHLRSQAQLGVVQPTLMPGSQPLPTSHQHADDTTLHMLQPADAHIALNGSVTLFCLVTGNQLNVSKSRGFLVQPRTSPAIAALLASSFLTGKQTVKHIGMRLGCDPTVQFVSNSCHDVSTMPSRPSAGVCSATLRDLP